MKLIKISFILLFAFVSFIGISVFAQDESCPDSFTSVRASHILVVKKDEALALRQRIENGEDFEAIAKKYSKCPSGADGGDLGWFSRGQMVQPFEDVAFSLPVGVVSAPVQTQFGWHLIKVVARR